VDSTITRSSGSLEWIAVNSATAKTCPLQYRPILRLPRRPAVTRKSQDVSTCSRGGARNKCPINLQPLPTRCRPGVPGRFLIGILRQERGERRVAQQSQHVARQRAVVSDRRKQARPLVLDQVRHHSGEVVTTGVPAPNASIMETGILSSHEALIKYPPRS
jgi:hypothetical protein